LATSDPSEKPDNFQGSSNDLIPHVEHVNDDDDYDGNSNFSSVTDLSEEDNNERNRLNSFMSEAIQQLHTTGIDTHFQSMLGGNKDNYTIKLMKKRMILFLSWAYSQINHDPIELSQINMVSWMLEVAQFHHNLISPYASHLELVQGFKGGTIINTLQDIVSVVNWLAHIQPIKNDDGSSLVIDVHSFEYILRLACKQYRKKKRKERSEHDMETSVANRRMPKGGIQVLIDCILDDHKNMEDIISKRGYLSKEEYDHLMGMLFASMYVMATQGRVGGVKSLQYGQSDELLQHGFVFSKDFKTKGTWIYQPVMISKFSSRLLRHYVTYIRPMITKEEIPNAHDPLWIDWNGNQDVDVGEFVTRYFRKQLNLHITTTSIRSMVETQAQQLRDNGVISEAQRESICHINGHSLQTAQLYYIERDRIQDVNNTRQFFEHIVSQGNGDFDKEKYSVLEFAGVEWAQPRQYEYHDWGTEHPDYNKGGNRAQWTNEELKFISDWYDDRVVKAIRGNLRMVSDFWNYIHGQGLQQALPIFHSNHVLNSTRLRHGFRIIRGERPAKPHVHISVKGNIK
jgi:hypothetical protein